MPTTQSRRSFLGTLSSAGAAGLIGASTSFAQATAVSPLSTIIRSRR
ncbi:MAG: twin-arginine translocation signal domain-containing protein [Xanthobacteraceae bacterium]